jgi:hypothetical protein
VLKLGCVGCLALLIALAVLGALGWGLVQASRTPDFVGAPSSAADGQRAQQKIFEILRRAGSGRPRSVTFSEQEVNAFLSRHLAEVGDLPLRNLAVRLHGEGRAEIAGQLPWKELTGIPGLSMIESLLPAASVGRGAWLTLRARVTLERAEGSRERRYLRLDVERFAIGRLRLPETMLRLLFEPEALGLLRSRMPDAVDGIRIEPGRLVIQTAG